MMMARLIAGAVALSLMGTAASAFQETKGGTTGSQQPAAQSQGKVLDLGDEPPAAKPSTGTEVRLPGLGKIGVLPKLDFGLELLYGVNEGRTLEPERAPQDPTEDGVQIRGSLKHRF
jgi:hypothetical protein